MKETIAIGIGIALMAFAVGLHFPMWQWWLFIISTNVVIGMARRGLKD